MNMQIYTCRDYSKRLECIFGCQKLLGEPMISMNLKSGLGYKDIKILKPKFVMILEINFTSQNCLETVVY